jgi:hypothetical protein
MPFLKKHLPSRIWHLVAYVNDLHLVLSLARYPSSSLPRLSLPAHNDNTILITTALSKLVRDMEREVRRAAQSRFHRPRILVPFLPSLPEGILNSSLPGLFCAEKWGLKKKHINSFF